MSIFPSEIHCTACSSCRSRDCQSTPNSASDNYPPEKYRLLQESPLQSFDYSYKNLKNAKSVHHIDSYRRSYVYTVFCISLVSCGITSNENLEKNRPSLTYVYICIDKYTHTCTYISMHRERGQSLQ